MSIERSVMRRAARHAALGEPVRLAIADALALGDASPSELAHLLNLSSNLLAHHLGVLEDAGVVVRSRSEADRRRTYVRLTKAGYPLVAPRLADQPARVVFVCTQNSARSQLAQALWASRAGVPVASAGTHPASHVHPRAVAVARRHGFELRRARTAHVADVLRAGDLVVAVCDRAYEELGTTVALHWSVPDPAGHEADAAFDEAFANLDERVGRLAAALATTTETTVDEEARR
jgi:ArsR family transcriptional regulator, arsenate/arsenite/antimonite-responsive transcriptional repressor / arsenate reductase (thioredoxin)